MVEQELCANLTNRRDFSFKPDGDDFLIVRLRNYFVSNGVDSSRPTAFHDGDSRNSLPFWVSVGRAASTGTPEFDADDLESLGRPLYLNGNVWSWDEAGSSFCESFRNLPVYKWCVLS
jgi:hypothetical protein